MVEPDSPQSSDTESASTLDNPRKLRVMTIGVLPALFLPLIGTIIYTTLPGESTVVGLAYGATKLIAIIWVPAFLLIERWRPSPESLRLDLHLKAVPLGILSGCVIGVLFWVFYLWTPLGDAVRGQSDRIHDFASSLNMVEHYVLFAVIFSLAHSLWEEIYWRWYVFGRLRLLTVKSWHAYAIASIAFASHHFFVLNSFFEIRHATLFTIGVAIGGALWCWMLERQRTFVGAWVSHAIVNAAFFAIGYSVMGL